MLVVDDILMSPFHGFGFILRQIHKAAQQALTDESDNLRAELSELYMMLETRQITENEFAEREATLLDRLTRLEEDTDADDDPQTDR